VFLGVVEGKDEGTDLVSLFKQVCRMEEDFREEIKRYVRRPCANRITPKEIPPLIAVAGGLPPTARNKMFNAVIASKNFGGRWSMPTLFPCKRPGKEANAEATAALLASSKHLGRRELNGKSDKGKAVRADVLLFEATNSEVDRFLEAYHWLETDYVFPARPADVNLQLDFLRNQKHKIKSWLIIAPQRGSSFGAPISIRGVGEFAVKKRQRDEGRGFQVVGEPDHRLIAEFLAEVEPQRVDGPRLVSANSGTDSFRDAHRGVFLFYPLRESPDDEVSIGFELLFAKNGLPFDLNFTVRRQAELESVVVQAQNAD
jgi:hypothetical protein